MLFLLNDHILKCFFFFFAESVCRDVCSDKSKLCDFLYWHNPLQVLKFEQVSHLEEGAFLCPFC